MAFSRNYLSAQSQPWAREIQKRLSNIETAFRSAEVNNTTRDDQLAASFRRLDATFLETQQAAADAQQASQDAIDAINRILGLGEPGGDPVDGANIVTDSITATQISSDYVYAGEIEAGQITSGSISGNFISGGTIVGTQLKTAVSNRRIELESTQIAVYDENNNFTGSIFGIGTANGATLELSSGGSGLIQIWNGGMIFYGSGGKFAALSSNGFGSFGPLYSSGDDIFIGGNNSYDPTFRMNIFNATNREMKVNSKGQFEADGWRAINDVNVGGDLFVSMNVGSGSTVRVTSGNKLVKSSSSLRHKEQIELLELDYDLLTSVNVKSFKFINDVKENGENASKIYGFIAEELDELGLQDLVIYEELEDGTKQPDGIREDSISAVTYWLVKVQAEKINNLENEINKLQDKIINLEGQS